MNSDFYINQLSNLTDTLLIDELSTFRTFTDGSDRSTASGHTGSPSQNGSYNSVNNFYDAFSRTEAFLAYLTEDMSISHDLTFDQLCERGWDLNCCLLRALHCPVYGI